MEFRHETMPGFAHPPNLASAINYVGQEPPQGRTTGALSRALSSGLSTIRAGGYMMLHG